jgi:hypothetical protein
MLGASVVNSISAKSLVEYTDSNNFHKKIIKNLKAEEKIIISLEKFGWDKCEIEANDTKTAVYARCWVDKRRLVSFSCWGDETVEVDIQGNGLVSVKLICKYK